MGFLALLLAFNLGVSPDTWGFVFSSEKMEDLPVLPADSLKWLTFS